MHELQTTLRTIALLFIHAFIRDVGKYVKEKVLALLKIIYFRMELQVSTR